MPSGEVKDFLFLNEENHPWRLASDQIKGLNRNIATGAAVADLDGDGDHDIITNVTNGDAVILENKSNPTSFLRVKLESTSWSHHHSKVIGYADQEKKVHVVGSTKGFMSSSLDDVIIHGELDSVQVIWPSGSTKVYDMIGGSRELVAKESDASMHKDDRSSLPNLLQMSVVDSSRHLENEYMDTERDRLMPWLLSTQGPASAIGDVNNDGREDIYIGGSKGNSASMWLQGENGSFSKFQVEAFVKDQYFEDVDAMFLDVDLDGDQDLFVATGSNEETNDSPFLLDRIYVNDGLGNLTRDLRALPLLTENTSSVSSIDYDNDGDLDIITGTKNQTGKYGYPSGIHLLVNNGSGKYLDATKKVIQDGDQLGMVSSVTWGDVDEDGDQDIVVVGEWMPITIFKNDAGRFRKEELENS